MAWAILNDVICPPQLTGSFLNSVANTDPKDYLAYLGTRASAGINKIIIAPADTNRNGRRMVSKSDVNEIFTCQGMLNSLVLPVCLFL